MKGVPLRIAIGPKDLEKGTVELARRDTFQKQSVSMDEVINIVPSLLIEIQELLFKKALKYRDDHITNVDDFCLLYTSPSPRDRTTSRMPSSA